MDPHELLMYPLDIYVIIYFWNICIQFLKVVNYET